MQSAVDERLRELFFDAFASRPQPLPEEILRPAVNREGDRLREFLAGKTPADLTAHDIRTEVEGNLWMLAPEAFRYFLPAFLHAALASYASISVFVSELVSALTEPHRADVEETLDAVARIPGGLGLPADMTDTLREQQLEWFDSGTPERLFHERVDGLTATEGAAVLAFFIALQEAHGEDFPFGDLKTAIDRYWGRYRAP